MSHLPCKNPNCNSYGAPHPNCRCYGEMAEGGEASFCGQARDHDPGCQYFKDGGEAIPDDAVTIDAPADIPDVDVTIDMPVEIPDDAVTIDSPVSDANADLDPAALQDKMREAAHPGGPTEYESPGNQLATVAEGLSRGVAGEAATLAENKLLGVPLEDIRGREAANPGEALASEGAGLVGGLLTGTGEAALASKGAEVLANYGRLSKAGAGALKGFSSFFMPMATDVGSRMILGENQEAPAATLIAGGGLATLFGAAGAKMGTAAGKSLTELAETKEAEKFGTKAASWLAGLGHAANPDHEKLNLKMLERIEGSQFSEKHFEEGQKFFKEAIENISKPTPVGKSIAEGLRVGGPSGAWNAAKWSVGKNIGNVVLGNQAKKIASWTSKKVAPPVILKILSNNTTEGMLEALDHADQVARGINMVDNAVEGVFRGAGTTAGRAAGKRKEIEDWIEGGGPARDMQQEIHSQMEAPQGFAEGGEVSQPIQKPNGVAIHFPEQNMVMQSAKARAGNYLSSLRPNANAPKLAFDASPDTERQKKTYNKALDIAAEPLSVLNHIKNGTVEPEHLKHLNSMFPEVANLLKEKAVEKITKEQLKGKRPNYKVRQGLSMLLGTPLSGELTPQNIAAAQATFAHKKLDRPDQPSGSAQRAKPNTRPLSKSDQAYLTDDQARMKRQARLS